MACKAVLGEDLLTAAGIDWKSHAKLIAERPAAQRITADRLAYQTTQAAKA
jgi:glutathione S-transferase